MKTRRLNEISVALTAGLLTMGTLAQEASDITVEALLPDGTAVAMPTICERQVLELMRSIGGPGNELGVPIIPRNVTVRLVGEGLTSQQVQADFRFGDLDFNRMTEGGWNPDLVPQVALDPAVASAQLVRFPAPLRGQLLAIGRSSGSENCFAAAVMEGASPLRADIITQIEQELQAAMEQQQIQQPSDFESDVSQRVSRVRADMRSVATALEAYYVDCNTYPAWIGGASDRSVSRGNSPLTAMPTFRRYEPGGPMTITTPIAYLTSYMRDPFNSGSAVFLDPSVAQDSAATHGLPVDTFSYFSDEGGWILVSPGPDGDFDILPNLHYNSKIAQPSQQLIPLGYDPTNGTVSDGDLYRVKQ